MRSASFSTLVSRTGRPLLLPGADREGLADERRLTRRVHLGTEPEREDIRAGSDTLARKADERAEVRSRFRTGGEHRLGRATPAHGGQQALAECRRQPATRQPIHRSVDKARLLGGRGERPVLVGGGAAPLAEARSCSDDLDGVYPGLRPTRAACEPP